MLADELVDEAWTTDVLAAVFPDAAARAVRRPDGRPPAAPGDHHDRAGQRGGQPGRHVVRLPRDGGERRVGGRRDPRVRGGPRRVRAGRHLGGGRGAGQPGADRPRRRWSSWSRGGCSTGRSAGWSAPAARRSTWPARSPGCGPASRRCCRELPSVLVGVERRSMDEAHRHAGRQGRAGRPGRAGDLGQLRLRPARRARDGAPRPAGSRPRWPQVYFVLSERFQIDQLLSHISRLPRGDRWQTLARMALRYDLYAALAALTAEVLQSTPADVAGRGAGVASGSRSTRPRSPGRRTRWATSARRRPTWRRCRCCCARSARW